MNIDEVNRILTSKKLTSERLAKVTAAKPQAKKPVESAKAKGTTKKFGIVSLVIRRGSDAKLQSDVAKLNARLEKLQLQLNAISKQVSKTI